MSSLDRSVVVILSGGLDSSTLLHHVKKNEWGEGYRVDDIYALTYFYGQKHSKEIDMAEYQAKAVGVKEHKLIDISFLKDLTKGASALTDDTIQVPHIKDVLGDPQPLSYVPNRNMILLSIAISYSESVGSLEVFFGAQKHDTYSGYWDASPEFLELMNTVLLLNRRNKVQIRAPFMNLKKKELIEIGMKLGVDYSKTWSCFVPGTLVPTKERLKRIETITEKDYVYTHKGRLRKVTKTMKFFKKNVELCSIHAYGSPVVQCTGEHPFLTTRGWVEAQELKKSDILRFYSLSRKKLSNVDPDFARMMGLFASEGSYSKDESLDFAFSLFEKDLDSIKFLVDYFIKREGVIPKVRYYSKSHSSYVDVYKTKLVRNLKKLTGDVLSHERNFMYVLDWSLESKLNFLWGVFSGDGFFDRNTDTLHLSLTNLSLVWVVSEVLKQFGCTPGLRYFQPHQVNGKKPQLNVMIQSTDLLKLMSKLGVKGVYEKRIRKFYTQAGRKIRKLSKELYTGYVYNLEVDEDESYIVYNIPVHNCYQGKEKACGVCGTCSDRIKAFKDMNMKDPLAYEVQISW